MYRILSQAVLVLLIAAPMAHAADLQFTHQGRVLDGTGAPIDGEISVTLALFPVAVDGSAAWSHVYNPVASGGYYAVQVGPDTALETALDTYSDLWLEVTVGSSTLSPREYLGSLPRSTSGPATAIQTLASPTGSCVVGAIALDTDSGQLRLCSTGTWNYAVLDNGTRRAWADGTYGAHCDAYRHPSAGYAYVGNTGSGLYAIDPDGDGNAITVYCDQATDGGGWTRVVNAVPYGSTSEIRVNQATVLSGTADQAANAGANGWVGLDQWGSLGDELRETCSGGAAGSQDVSGSFSINPGGPWSINWGISGNWTLHNDQALSTSDFDRDTWGDVCSTYTGHESTGWGWHRSCHIGSFWFGSTPKNICHVNPGATHSGPTSESTHVQWFLR